LYINDSPCYVQDSHNRNKVQPEHWRCDTSRIAFSGSGRSVKCYSAGIATPSTRISKFSRDGNDNVTFNKTEIDLDDDTTEWFSVEDAFFGYHETVGDSDSTDFPSCINRRLSFATVALASHCPTIACILHSFEIIPEGECPHAVDLDEIPSPALYLDTSVVARLWGFKQQPTTMPAVMAFAQQGTRIAIAYWDKIFIWALQPKAIAQLNDKTIDHQIYEKTYDRNLRCSVVVLKPIVLKADAVVHKMAFTANANELVMITDKGLQIWDLGPSAMWRHKRALPNKKEMEEGEEETGKGETGKGETW
jgi:hypothetical protein